MDSLPLRWYALPFAAGLALLESVCLICATKDAGSRRGLRDDGNMVLGRTLRGNNDVLVARNENRTPPSCPKFRSDSFDAFLVPAGV